MRLNFSLLPEQVSLGTPTRLIKLAQKMELLDYSVSAPKGINVDVLAEKMELFLAGEVALSPREESALGAVVTGGNPAWYKRPHFNQMLARCVPLVEARPRRLLAFVNAYFTLNPEYAPVNSKILGNWICTRLNRVALGSPALQHWKALRNWFDGAYPETAGRAFAWERSLVEVFAGLKILVESHVVSAFLEGVAVTHWSVKERRNRLLDFLDNGARSNVNPQARSLPVGTISRCLSVVLSAMGGEPRYVAEPDQELISFSLKHLGDPFIDPKGHWKSVPAEARDLIRRWVSAEDLRRFFDEIAGDPRRRDFWRRFVLDGRVTFSRLALNNHNLRTCSRELVEQVMRKRHARVTGEASAFILGIDDKIVVVEFSLTKNATYVYYKDQLGADFLWSPSYGKNDLKSPHGTKLIHQDTRYETWETKFLHCLNEEFEIRPPRVAR